MNDNIDKLKRAIRYLFRPGNTLYLGILAILLSISGFVEHAQEQTIVRILTEKGLDPNCNLAEDIQCFSAIMEAGEQIPTHYGLMLLGFIIQFLFSCKMCDGIMRLSEGLEDDPVPFAPVSVIPFLTPFKYSIGLFLIGLCALPLMLLSFKVWMVVLFLILFIFNPAMLMNLLGNDSIASMIRPSGWIKVIQNMGPANYLAMLLVPFAVALLLGISVGIVAGVSHSAPVKIILGSVLQAFVAGLSFIYIGYFMRADTPQGLSEAELRVLHEADTYRMDDDAKKQFAQDLLAADALRDEGSFGEMEALLLPYTSMQHSIAQYFPAYRRLYEHYSVHRRYDTLQNFEQRLIEAAAQGNERCYLAVRKAVENIALDDPARLPADWVQPLARMAGEHHDYDIVLALTRNFAQRHPGHQHILDNYYLAARALDKKGNRAKAIALLEQLIKHYPDHPKIAQVRRSYELLQKADGVNLQKKD